MLYILYSLLRGKTLFARINEKLNDFLAAKNKPNAPIIVPGIIRIRIKTMPPKENAEYIYPANAP